MWGMHRTTVSPSSSHTNLQHAVRGRMLGPDVDEHVVGLEVRFRKVDREPRGP